MQFVSEQFSHAQALPHLVSTPVVHRFLASMFVVVYVTTTNRDDDALSGCIRHKLVTDVNPTRQLTKHMPAPQQLTPLITNCEQPAASKHGQPAAFKHEQPAAFNCEQLAAFNCEQLAAFNCEQPAAFKHEQPVILKLDQPAAFKYARCSINLKHATLQLIQTFLDGHQLAQCILVSQQIMQPSAPSRAVSCVVSLVPRIVILIIPATIYKPGVLIPTTFRKHVTKAASHLAIFSHACNTTAPAGTRITYSQSQPRMLNTVLDNQYKAQGGETYGNQAWSLCHINYEPLTACTQQLDSHQFAL